MSSLQSMTPSHLQNLIQEELESNEKFMKTFRSKILTNETIEIKSSWFSEQLKNSLINGQDKRKVTEALTKAIEFLYGSKWGFKQLKKIKTVGIKIEFDGKLLETIVTDEQIQTYRKEKFEDNEDDTGFAISWLTKEWYIETHHIISKIEIYENICNELKTYGVRQKDIPRKSEIMKQIDYVFKIPNVFSLICKIAYEMGKSNESVLFSSDQIDEISWYLKGKLHARRIMFGRTITDMLYLWNGKCFRHEIRNGLIENEIENIVFQATKHVRIEIQTKLLAIAEIVDESEISSYLHIQCLKNGYYDMKNFEYIEEINPDETFVTQELPIKYDPKAKCPNLAQYVVNAIAEPIQRIGVWEMMAWCVDNGLNLNKAFFLVGVSAQNGKSTFLKWVEYLLGEWNCGHVPLELMDTDRFACAGLINKKANLFADIKNGMIKNNKTFLMIVTRDRVYVQFKGKDPFYLLPECVNIFSVNKPPEFEETGDQTYRRIYPIDFINKFKENPTKEELEDGIKKIDFELVDNMFTEKEKSGVFNVLIACAKRLRKQRRFSHAPIEEEVREYWENATDHLLDFSKKFLIEKKGCYILSDDMKDTYENQYCKNRRIPPLGERKFIHEFPMSCIFNTKYGKVSTTDGRHCWKDIWWNYKQPPGNLMMQDELPITKEGQAKVRCKECIDKNHDNCLDRDRCLCSKEGHGSDNNYKRAS
ncbi:MAG: hypothetical protein GWN01_01905 [Nitrosopumilaceae archaeon]|nr:hypothetical protein [Nitrosopumilaceae archaeon]NIT99727.1 hypothetical protein [Nitrosopumilaceae archaeon]NIU88588.1 hypothetical protein [Nitrosopumilaceae archaeon]NIV64862.1 hypothetical protein [Nitrosopumilaceae archaeon]NIX60330.1 hypothetical protein [Nitrosopumilaceae archaeon]